MRTRIGAQLILGVVLVTVLTIGLMALVILPRHRAELIAQWEDAGDAETLHGKDE